MDVGTVVGFCLFVFRGERERWMDGWMVYCIINGLTVTILWVNDEEND